MLIRLKKYWFYIVIGVAITICTLYYGIIFGKYKEISFTKEDVSIATIMFLLFSVMIILYFVLF